MINTGYLDVGVMPKGMTSYVEIFFMQVEWGGDCHGLNIR